MKSPNSSRSRVSDLTRAELHAHLRRADFIRPPQSAPRSQSSHERILHLPHRVRHTSHAQRRAKQTHKGIVSEVTAAAGAAIQDEIATVAKLSELASQQPYYKNNFMWTRNMQDVVCSNHSSGESWLSSQYATVLHDLVLQLAHCHGGSGRSGRYRAAHS